MSDDIRFHCYKKNLFACHDRHSKNDDIFWADWDNPFVLRFQNAKECWALCKKTNSFILISINGEPLMVK